MSSSIHVHYNLSLGFIFKYPMTYWEKFITNVLFFLLFFSIYSFFFKIVQVHYVRMS